MASRTDSRLVWCRYCHVGVALKLRQPAMPRCPSCNADDPSWWTITPPYVLSSNDRRFLLALRIAPDD